MNTDDVQIDDFIIIDGLHDILVAQSDGEYFNLSFGTHETPTFLTENNDTYTGASFYENIIHGLAGNDYLTGGNLDDFIYGGDGNDQFYPSMGNDSFFGGEGKTV